MIDIEEKEPKIFDKEPAEITIDDAKKYFNAKYLNNQEIYDTDTVDVLAGGVKAFTGSLKKMPEQFRMMGGQALYTLGKNTKEQAEYQQRVSPKGDMIFNGNLEVKLGDSLMESGRYNIMTANRNLETLNREIENEMPHLTEEDRKGWTMMIAEQGLDYATMLGLSYINPYAGIGYMSAKILGQETEEGAEAYKKKYGTIEGFEELSGDELALNIGNTAVQAVIEKAFGAPAQLKRFKTMKDFGKAFFTGFGEEFLTENLQNVSDAVFDYIGKRFDEDETIWTNISDNFKGTIVAGMFGGTAGTAFAIHNRAKGIESFEQLLDGSDVPVEQRNALATELYESGVNNMQAIVTKELELNSQLRAKHGKVYDKLKSQIERQYRDVGAFEGKTEAEIAQYIEGTAKQFADNVLAEAQKRNMLIDDVVNSQDIVYRNGKLWLAPKTIVKKPRTYHPEKMSLLTYLKFRGGLKDTGGDLKSRDAGKQVIGLINNKSGRSLDDAALDAWESGYFPQFPERPTINDLLDAIDDSLRGKKIYRESYRPATEQKQQTEKVVESEGMLDDYLSDFFSDEDLKSMSLQDKERFYSEIQEQSRAISEDDYIQQELDSLSENEQERYSIMRENGATHEEAMDHIRSLREENQGDIFSLYQESFDIAEESARLDDIYPAYEGETITINGQEKTVYNSDGARIAKSKEALENFYKWFGDSKVIDEQGRPLVVYHGTNAEFDTFKGTKILNSSEGVGFNFAVKKDIAEGFGKVMPVYLKLENPVYAYSNIDLVSDTYEDDFEIENQEAIRNAVYKVKENLEQKGYTFYNEVDSDMLDTYAERSQAQEVLDGLLDLGSYIQEDYDAETLYNDIRQAEIDAFGIDGYVTNNYGATGGKVYIAFESNQIKSTSNRGTYSESENIYYQPAYAGSRVDYDRPSLEAIGSGEGNQAHGWGLYYALNKDIAERYRKNFTRGATKFTYDGKEIRYMRKAEKEKSPAIIRVAQDFFYNTFYDESDQNRAKLKAMERWYEWDLGMAQRLGDKKRAKIAQENLEAVKSFDMSKAKETEQGQVHEVDIPENPYLLDEELTFRNQSEFVQNQLKKLVSEENLTDKFEIYQSEENPKYNILENSDGEEIYKTISKALGSDKAASQLLEKYGIKGITYDGRQDGRCFVIFNPADVKVIRKFYQGEKGQVKGSFDRLTKSIKITKEADFSTYQHEFAHFWLDNIWDYVQSGKASEEYIKQFNELKKWLGVKSNQNYFTRAQHEKFARGYEKFLYEGKAVNPIIASAFDDYEKFIRDVYDDITEIDIKAGKKYEPLTREAYNFFNSMVSGELTPPANLPSETVEQARETVAKSETEAKETVAEETKILKENREDYSLTPVKTDTKTGYLTAYEKMTGEKVEAGVAELGKEMDKAREFVENNTALAEKIVNGEAPVPENMLKNTIYLAYEEIQKKLGNTDKRVNALLNQAQELRAYGQEIASQKLAYADQSTPFYWISRVMSARAEAIAESNKMTVQELQDLINKEVRPAIGDEKAVENVVQKLKDELGVKELYQAEQADFSTKDGVYKYVTTKLGIIPTTEQATEITKRADDMLTNLRNAQVNGNPSVEYFVKYKDLEDYANSIAPSSNLRVLVSVIGKGNLLASFKSPLTNVIANTPVAGLQAALRRQKLGIMNSIVNPELIKQNKQTSWEIYRKTGYTLNNMTDVSPKGMTLGEKITQSQGEGAIRKVGRIYENIIYKWSLGAPDLLYKDFAFNDYVALAATKESGGDVAKANAIYKDAVKIMPETELGQRIRQEAIEDSLVSTYQNNGKISESALKIRKSLDFGVGFGEFIAPFVKTPANVVGMGLDTAFGSVRAITNEIIRDVKAGKVLTPKSENIRLIAQNGLGLLVASLLLASIDDDDYMPGYALATNKDKQLAKELNIPFNSIRIGDTWYSMDYLGPLASPLMGLLQARREDGTINSVMGYIKSGAIQTLSIPALGNIGDLQQNITNLVRKDGVDALGDVASDIIEATVARSVPSIISDIAKVLDEGDREAKTLSEKLQMKLPIIREDLPERYNVTTGDVEPRAESTIKRILTDLFAGARVKEQVVNDVADELFRLNNNGYGVSLTDVTRSGLLSKADSSTKALIKRDFAKMYSKGVKELIKTYKYKHANDEDRKDMIDSLRRKYVSELKKKYLKKTK